MLYNFSLVNRNPAIEPPLHLVPVSCKHTKVYKRNASVYMSASRLGSLVSASMNACTPIPSGNQGQPPYMLSVSCTTWDTTNIYIAFNDLKKVYGRVDRNKLWSCLEGAGLKERMGDFLRAAYKECKCEVKVGDIVSDSLDVVKGLKQGCVLSPVLFLLCINSLVDRLRGVGVGVG